MRRLNALIPAQHVESAAVNESYVHRLPPSAPANVPEGSTAGEQEMLAAMRQFKKYNADTEAYLKFLEYEEKARRIDSSTRNRLHDDAVDALRRSVHHFNLQVRMYKARDDVRQGASRERRH